MVEFWLAASALVGIALLWILPVLMRPSRAMKSDQQSQNIAIARRKLSELDEARKNNTVDQAEYEALRQELEQALALDIGVANEPVAESSGAAKSHSMPVLAVLLSVAMPIAAGAVYLSVGQPGAIFGSSSSSASGSAEGRQPSVGEMMTQLKARLRDNPDDLRGWTILARSSMSLQEYDDAVMAYKRVNELQPNDADVLVQYADAIAMQAGGALAGKPTKLINQALALNPNQPQGLWLAGMAAERRGEYQLALNLWNRLMPQLENDPQSRSELQGLVRNLRTNAASNGVTLVDDEPQSTAPASDPVSIKVTVSLAPELESKVSDDQTVFVFARASNGPPMPLAAVRRRVANLPFTVVLDDSSSMLPDMTISSFPQVSIVARVSASGQPVAEPGDLEGSATDIDGKTTDTLNIVIDSVVQ